MFGIVSESDLTGVARLWRCGASLGPPRPPITACLIFHFSVQLKTLRVALEASGSVGPVNPIRRPVEPWVSPTPGPGDSSMLWRRRSSALKEPHN